jgi:hypothetical protein
MSNLGATYLLEAGGSKKDLNRAQVFYNKVFSKGGQAVFGTKKIDYDNTFYVPRKEGGKVIKDSGGNVIYDKITITPTDKANTEKFLKEAISFSNSHVLPTRGKSITAIGKKEYEKIHPKLKTLKFKGSDGRDYLLSGLNTNVEFGGYPPGKSAGGDAEVSATVALDAIVQAIKKKTGLPYAKIQIPGCSGPKGASYFKISKVLNTQKQTEESDFVKADITGLDENGKSVLFISYKDNAGRKKKKDNEKFKTLGKPLPSAFSQYGGISAKGSPEVHHTKQVQDFLTYLKIVYGTKGPRIPEGVLPIGMRITGRGAYEIKMKSIFGGNWVPKWTSDAFNSGNCQLVFQGRFDLECVNPKSSKEKWIYRLKKTSYSHFLVNNENCDPDKEEGYTPILLARTGETTAAKQRVEPVSGLIIRAGIFPEKQTNVKTMLDEKEISRFVAQYRATQKTKGAK